MFTPSSTALQGALHSSCRPVAACAFVTVAEVSPISRLYTTIRRYIRRLAEGVRLKYSAERRQECTGRMYYRADGRVA